MGHEVKPKYNYFYLHLVQLFFEPNSLQPLLDKTQVYESRFLGIFRFATGAPKYYLEVPR